MSLKFADSRVHLPLAAMLTCAVSLSAMADDIDVYKAQIAAQQKPNVLFVLDYSGSMNRSATGSGFSRTEDSRIDVLRDAIEQLIDDNLDTFNAGLGSFFNFESTGIRWPISDLRADASTIDPQIPAGQLTVAEIIKQRVANRDPGGLTATVDALVEAAEYFRGDPVTHNDTPVNDLNGHRPPRWNVATQRYEGVDLDVSIAAAYTPTNAYSDDLIQTFYCNDYSESGGPNFCEDRNVAQSDCQSVNAEDPATQGYEYINNLWGDYERCEYRRTESWITPRFNSPIADTCEAQENAIVLISDGVPTVSNRGDSLRRLIGDDPSVCEDLSTSIFANQPAAWRDEGNCAIEIVRGLATEPVNPFLPNSRVRTYTVGFNTGQAGQEFLRRLGEDEGNGEFYFADNPEALTSALNSAIEDILSGSQSFTGLSVDVDKASFANNDRAYFSLFSPSNRRAWSGNLKGYFLDTEGLVDINGDPATEDNLFVDTAQSFWSEAADGAAVTAGGASEQVVSGNRNLYTFVGDTLPDGGVDFVARDDVYLDSTNGALSNAVLGLENNQQRTAVLDWIQTAPMGAPLHTKSVSVNYDDRRVVYVMTNQGFLHAIDASSPSARDVGDNTGGEELFAFMPQSLLDNLPLQFTNTIGEDFIYGLDGPLTRWHDDTNGDGIANNNESVMLYFGMRRGGSEYYAMDVSDPEAPVLKWTINQDTPGFDRLAQSWSRMSIIEVEHNGDPRRVLAFGAGFDADAQDDVNTPVSSRGNAIYMVDEDDGTLLWSIDGDSHADMNYSIASDLRVIDSDGDQLADRLYVGDLAGQVWRVDFEDIVDPPTVTRLANLADDDHQPFFYPPSVAFSDGAGDQFLTVSIGSGNRTNPLLADVQNNLYMIRDENVAKGAPTAPFSTVTVDDLYDATSNALQSSNADTVLSAQASLDSSRGWRIRLAEGEKSLSSVITFEGKLLATTFTPDLGYTTDPCEYMSSNTFYSVEVDNATLPLGTTFVQTETGTDRTGQSVPSNGIASKPDVFSRKDDDSLQVFVGTTLVDSFPRTLRRVYWHAR